MVKLHDVLFVAIDLVIYLLVIDVGRMLGPVTRLTLCVSLPYLVLVVLIANDLDV